MRARTGVQMASNNPGDQLTQALFDALLPATLSTVLSHARQLLKSDANVEALLPAVKQEVQQTVATLAANVSNMLFVSDLLVAGGSISWQVINVSSSGYRRCDCLCTSNRYNHVAMLHCDLSARGLRTATCCTIEGGESPMVIIST